MCFRLHVLGEITLGLEAEVAIFAGIRTNIGMRAYVLLQHRWFFAANAALVADITTASAAAYISVVVVRFIAADE